MIAPGNSSRHTNRARPMAGSGHLPVRSGVLPDRMRHILGFMRHEARAVCRAVLHRWERYSLLREIVGEGSSIHPAAMLARDATGKIVLGKRTHVAAYVYLCALDHGTLTLGDDVYINEFNNLRAGGGNITIGSHTIIAQYVSIIASNHRIASRDVFTRDAGIDETRRGVVIGRGVWIAANAVILPGVEVGDGAIIGAGSIVTKSIPPFAIAAGNPARVMRYRE